eukprot:121842-Prorocentrum_minimum.AAC.1
MAFVVAFVMVFVAASTPPMMAMLVVFARYPSCPSVAVPSVALGWGEGDAGEPCAGATVPLL